MDLSTQGAQSNSWELQVGFGDVGWVLGALWCSFVLHGSSISAITTWAEQHRRPSVFVGAGDQ